MEKNWIDRHGRLPHPIQNLFTIARIKAEAASNNVSSVELSIASSYRKFLSQVPGKYEGISLTTGIRHAE